MPSSRTVVQSYPDRLLAQLAELVAAEALCRRYQRLGYLSSRQGEIDFFSPSAFALDVKWSPVAHNLSRAFLNLRMPNKVVWTQNNFLDEWPV